MNIESLTDLMYNIEKLKGKLFYIKILLEDQMVEKAVKEIEKIIGE